MTPDERQLLSGLFDRMNGAANQPRDREADGFIADRVRSQPYAPYLLSQTVIVQEHALRAAAERIQQLEAQVQQGGGGQPPQEETSFLGSIGKSIFGSSQPQAAPQQQRPSVPTTGGFGPGPLPQEPGPFARPGGPWGQGAQTYANAAPQGGGFLKGALGAAAGVAGGVLAVDALRGLFGGHNNPFGMASGFENGGFGNPGGETVVNNYYDGNGQGADALDPGADPGQQGFLQEQSDDFAGDSVDPGTGGDDSYNV